MWASLCAVAPGYVKVSGWLTSVVSVGPELGPFLPGLPPRVGERPRALAAEVGWNPSSTSHLLCGLVI